MGNQCVGKRECCAGNPASTPGDTPRGRRKPVVGDGPLSNALQGVELNEKERQELSKVDKEVQQARNDLKDAQMKIANLKAEVEFGRKDRQKMTMIDQEIQKTATILKDKRKEIADLTEENARLRQLMQVGARDVIQKEMNLKDAKQEISNLREENARMKDTIAEKYAVPVGGQ